MSDFKIVDVPSMLTHKVTISDEFGERPDDEWSQEAVKTQFVFAEFLRDQRLIASDIDVSRRPDLVVRWSELTATGQAFVRAHYDRWLVSTDRSGTTEKAMQTKLARRWDKFRHNSES